MYSPVAANILGTLGALCWSIQLLPQILLNYRRHHTTGLQPSMMLLWASAGVPLGVYNISQSFNIALRIQPQILTLLSLITWAQCYYYSHHWPWTKCALYLAALGAFMGGVEVGLVFALRDAKGVQWPVTLMAVLAAFLLAAGVGRHYWDIWTHRTVRGISFIFVGIDAAGDLFSLISVFFQQGLNVSGMVIYGTELTLWVGVFICGGWFNLLPWVKGKIARRRILVEERRGGEETENGAEMDGGVAMHAMPSSTSVFRTPNDGLVERRNDSER